MRVLAHAAASAAAGAAVGLLLDWRAGASLFVFGTLLDLDHLEQFHASGLPSGASALVRSALHDERGLETRYGFTRGVPSSWAFPVLHSVEVAALAAAGWLITGSLMIAGALLGIGLHIIMDIRHYPLSPFFFSLTWRGLARKRLMAAWRGFRAGAGRAAPGRS